MLPGPDQLPATFAESAGFLNRLMRGLFLCLLCILAFESRADHGTDEADSTPAILDDSYVLSLSADGSQLTTAFCFHTQLNILRPYAADTELPVSSVELYGNQSSGVHALNVSDGEIILPDGVSAGCVRWLSDMTAVEASRYQQAISPVIRMISIRDWLWLPDNHGERPGGNAPRVTVRRQQGQSVSAPWLRIESQPAQEVFQLPSEFNGRRGFIIIGKFMQQQIDGLLANGGAIDLAILESKDAAQPTSDVIRGWLQHHVSNASLAFDYLPVDRLQVIALPINRFVRPSSENRGFVSPVPWAEVLRGGGTGIIAVLDSSRPLADFQHDWTLTHELSHLLHPVLHGSDRWLYEGIGTYYQNVLRSRSGDISEWQAWQKLHEGLGRGQRATIEGTTLSQRGRGRRSFMRIYWTGVVLALEIDLRLRRESGNTMSLDDVLRGFSLCCLEDQTVWEGMRFMKELDRISGSDYFSAGYSAMKQATSFPDYSALYEVLGITIDEGRVQLDEAEPYATRRQWIMSQPHSD